MPADVTITNDRAEFFSVRENAWWDALGQYTVENAPTDPAAARKLAGLEWDVVEAPDLQFSGIDADGNAVYDPALSVVDGLWTPNPDRVRWVRSDNGTTLHVPNKTSEIVPNEAVFELAYTIIGDDPNAKLITAGSLGGGKEVWALVELAEPIHIEGDHSATLPYFAVKLPHDGSGSLRAEFTMVRIVCRNTWRMSESLADQLNTAFSVRHSSTWRERLDSAKDGILLVRAELENYKTFMDRLSRVTMTERQVDEFIDRMFPAPTSLDASSRVINNVYRDREILRNGFKSKDGTVAGMDNTAYKALMAGTEFLDWTRKGIRTGIVQRTLLDPTPRKQRVLSIIGDVTGVDMAAMQHVDKASRVIA